MLTQVCLAFALASPVPDILAVYRNAGSAVYVGVDAEPPDSPTVQYYDARTRRLGTLAHVAGDVYRTADSPALTFDLGAPSVRVHERRFVLGNGAQRFGGSLWYAAGARRRATVVLIQGADDSTRQMGFLIPYFVGNGLNVVTYDQRGTGVSEGNWRYTSPQSKADDVVALLQLVKAQPQVDARRTGAWAASNGGWVAPIVASRFPLAFLILKSTPSGSITENVLYEIRQSLREGGDFTPKQIAQALAFEQTMFASVKNDDNWGAAAQALASARTQPWFSYMRIPPGMPIPPPPAMLAGLRAALIYDPAAMLQQLRTPTLALFGALDKNVDAARSAARLRAAFKQSGEPDLTIVTFPNAGHLLTESRTGYEDRQTLPVRYVGYPETMVRWLIVRHFVR